jgi:hypothetical protein
VSAIGKPITGPLLYAFHLTFLTVIVGFVGFVVAVLAAPTHQPVHPGITLVLVGLATVAGWTWVVLLGVIAHRLGRSWVIWVGLSIITSPVGPLVAYVLMLGHISSAKAANAQAVVS